MLGWQEIAVALIILGALAYVARRGLARLRSFRAGGAKQGASCATGCGKCGDEGAPAPRPARALVQINSSRTPARHDSR